MDKLRYVGLDVHKERIVIAVSEKGASEAVVLGTFPQEVPKVIRGVSMIGIGQRREALTRPARPPLPRVTTIKLPNYAHINAVGKHVPSFLVAGRFCSTNRPTIQSSHKTRSD